MEFTTTKKHALAAIKKTIRAVNPKSSLELLTMIGIKATGEDVTFYGSDLMQSIEATSQCETKKAGETMVNGMDLLKLVSKMPDKLKWKISKDKMQISSGKSKYSLPCILPQRAVTPPESSVREIKRVQSRMIMDAIATVKHAVCPDDARPHLACIDLKIGRESIVAAGTDGHRCAKYSEEKIPEDPLSITIPRGMIDGVLAVISDSGIVDLSAFANDAYVIAANSASIYFKSSGAVFPPYEKVFGNPNHTMTCDPEEFLSALIRIQSASDMCTISIGKSSIDIVAIKGKEGSETIACESDSDAVIGISPRYVIESLVANSETESMKVRFEDPLSPAIFCYDNADEVIMPMRID